MSGAGPEARPERLQQDILDARGRHEKKFEVADSSALDLTEDENQFSSRLEALLLDIKELDLTEKVQDKIIQKLCGGCADIHVRVLADGSCIAEKRIRFATKDDLLKVSKRVARELRIWFRLKHPNILPLKGYIKRLDDDFPSIVTDWMEHGSLEQFLKKTVDIDEIGMIKGLTDGLSYLHSEGVVHGDLKAANVVISQDHTPMLMDFGISHLLSGTSTVETATRGYKGSVRWIAPELMFPEGQEDDSGVHTKSSDVWALGMTWLEVLTKKFPYAHLTMDHQVIGTLFQKALPRTPDDSKSWPDSKKRIWDLCLLCWCIDVAQRPSAKDLAREVYLILADRKKKKSGVSVKKRRLSRPLPLPPLYSQQSQLDSQRTFSLRAAKRVMKRVAWTGDLNGGSGASAIPPSDHLRKHGREPQREHQHHDRSPHHNEHERLAVSYTLPPIMPSMDLSLNYRTPSEPPSEPPSFLSQPHHAQSQCEREYDAYPPHEHTSDPVPTPTRARRSGKLPAPAPRKMRIGLWNQRGDHLVDGYTHVMYCPPERCYPPDLTDYPDDAFQDHFGHVVMVRPDAFPPELPDSVPAPGQKTAARSYDSFIKYALIHSG